MYKRILVPIDGSDTGRRGLKEAITLATGQKATLCLLHVTNDFPPTPPSPCDRCEARWSRKCGHVCVPYRSRADTLSGACERLGADTVRYVFVAADLHRSIHPGRPAHPRRLARFAREKNRAHCATTHR